MAYRHRNRSYRPPAEDRPRARILFRSPGSEHNASAACSAVHAGGKIAIRTTRAAERNVNVDSGGFHVYLSADYADYTDSSNCGRNRRTPLRFTIHFQSTCSRFLLVSGRLNLTVVFLLICVIGGICGYYLLIRFRLPSPLIDLLIPRLTRSASANTRRKFSPRILRMSCSL